MTNHTGTIKEIKEINKNVYSVEIFSSTLENIEPGQYISILCPELTFRRPFSIADFKDNVITILVKKRGKGTDYISKLTSGDSIKFSAPLGNKFIIENKKTLLVGAGIGVAPLIYLNKKLKNISAKTFLATGFLTKDDIINSDLEEWQNSINNEKIFISTDDGSNGHKGFITDYLEQIINEFRPERIISCAPHQVLKQVANISEKSNIECFVCMEKTMACGVGVCRGCVIDIKQDNKIIHKTICKDGPVFLGSEVVW